MTLNGVEGQGLTVCVVFSISDMLQTQSDLELFSYTLFYVIASLPGRCGMLEGASNIFITQPMLAELCVLVPSFCHSFGGVECRWGRQKSRF